MWHIYQHTEGKLKGKFDFAFISGYKFICGSQPQGYERKAACFTTLRSMLIKKLGLTGFRVQDDTGAKPVVWLVTVTHKEIAQHTKPAKPYIPQRHIVKKVTSFV